MQVLEHQHRGRVADDAGHDVQAGVQPLDRAEAGIDERGDLGVDARGAAQPAGCVDGVQQEFVGRASEPGSAWPTSTTVSGGRVSRNSWVSRVLPMPGSPPMIATCGRPEATSRVS